jgi:hypothetical protein
VRTDLTIVADVPEPSPDAHDPDLRPDEIELGQWFWVSTEESQWNEKEEVKEVVRWLGCVDEIGSNYVHLQEPHREHRDWRSNGHSVRVHFEKFYEPVEAGGAACVWVPNAEEVLKGYVAHHESRLRALMNKVQQVVAQLGMAPTRELRGTTGDVAALSTVLSGQSYDDYKQALIKAKKEELPDIFRAIELEHAQLAKWMSAELIPLKAKTQALQVTTDHIEDRIFNVELYAGLIEATVKVRDGEPAKLDTPLALLQRRHYMDEECLARYEAGGMRFEDIRAFDAWIARDENMKRLLPFERCMLAFRVRRFAIQQRVDTISEWIALWQENEACKQTYLYIRNGEQLHRLRTGVDFGEQLFPDMTQEILDGRKLWAVMRGDRGPVSHLITDDDLQERRRQESLRHQAAVQQYHTLFAEPCTCTWRVETDKRDEDYGKEVVQKWCEACSSLLCWSRRHGSSSNDHRDHVEKRMNLDTWISNRDNFKPDRTHYEPFDKTSVFYDDILKHVREIQKAHNRIALVVQGVLDRSPMLHPHPPWQIWTPEGFAAGVQLVYDESRALTVGDAPDFEAYRKRLNASLKPGDVTVGQRDVWSERRREKREERRDEGRRSIAFDPGPEMIAEVKRIVVKRNACVYEWTRKSLKGKKRWVPNPKRPGWGRDVWDYADIPVRMEVPVDEVFNVSAYTPGDFRQFYEDPRTRAQYLKWAPILLAAEEYHAGRKDGVPERFCTSCDHRHVRGAACQTVREDDGATCLCDSHTGPKWFVPPPGPEESNDNNDLEDEEAT